MSNIELFELLVPTTHRLTGNPIRTRYHRVFDAKVREISGGLTILKPVAGQWINQDNIIAERMIPVRFAVSNRGQLEEILAFSKKYYDQQKLFCYKISEEVIIY